MQAICSQQCRYVYGKRGRISPYKRTMVAGDGNRNSAYSRTVLPSVISYLPLFLVTFHFSRAGNIFQVNGPPLRKRRMAVSRSPHAECHIIVVINALLRVGASAFSSFDHFFFIRIIEAIALSPIFVFDFLLSGRTFVRNVRGA